MTHPYDAGGVHGEPDELSLVEVLGEVAGLDGIHGTHDDEKEVPTHWCDDAPTGCVTDQLHLPHNTLHKI